MRNTPETDAQLTTFTSLSKLKKHFVNRTGTVSAEFARGLERERDNLQDQRDFAMGEMARLERERDEARAVSKYWQEQFGHSVQEHEWQSFPWEAAK